MAERWRTPRRRRWASTLALVFGAYLFVIGLFAAGTAWPYPTTVAVENLTWWWAGTSIGGALAIAAVVVALRRPGLARLMTAAAGLLVLSTLFAFRGLPLAAVTLVMLPGVVLLAVTPFLGAMPSPEEEGHRR